MKQIITIYCTSRNVPNPKRRRNVEKTKWYKVS